MASSLEDRIARINRARNVVIAMMVVASMVAVMTVPAFASGATGQISDAVSKGLKSAYDLITSIIMPMGALVFAFAAAKLMIGGRRAMEEGQTKLFVILLVLAGVYLAPIIIQEVSGWFKDVGGAVSFW